MAYQITVESKERTRVTGAIMLHLDAQASTIANLAVSCSGEELGREWDFHYNSRSITFRFKRLTDMRTFLKTFYACWSNWFLVDQQTIKEKA